MNEGIAMRNTDLGNKKRRLTGRGQVLVLIVIALIALLGFTALAIDGGNIYTSRRNAQTVADTAAYAAAADVASRIKYMDNTAWGCAGITSSNADWVDAANVATNRVGSSNLQVSTSIGRVTHATGEVRVDFLIDEGNEIKFVCGEGAEDFVDVHVRLTQKVNTTFMHLFNPVGVSNTVESVVRVQPGRVLGSGASIVATRNACEAGKGGVTLEGEIDLNLSGGSIRSNHCCMVTGRNDILITGGAWACNATIVLPTDEPEKNRLDPDPVSGPDTDIAYTPYVEKLTTGCNGLPGDANSSLTIDGTETLAPGKYGTIYVKKYGELLLEDGLYCIYGDLKINGALKGKNVTIFMPEEAGSVTAAPGSQVVLSAPLPGCQNQSPSCAPAKGGLLFLYLPNGSHELALAVNSDSSYRGTLLVPNTLISLVGDGSKSAVSQAQFIGESVRISGEGKLNLQYDATYFLQEAPVLTLQH